MNMRWWMLLVSAAIGFLIIGPFFCPAVHAQEKDALPGDLEKLMKNVSNKRDEVLWLDALIRKEFVEVKQLLAENATPEKLRVPYLALDTTDAKRSRAIIALGYAFNAFVDLAMVKRDELSHDQRVKVILWAGEVIKIQLFSPPEYDDVRETGWKRVFPGTPYRPPGQRIRIPLPSLDPKNKSPIPAPATRWSGIILKEKPASRRLFCFTKS